MPPNEKYPQSQHQVSQSPIIEKCYALNNTKSNNGTYNVLQESFFPYSISCWRGTKDANLSALSNTFIADRPVGPLLGTVATAAGPNAALKGVDGTEPTFVCGICRGP